MIYLLRSLSPEVIPTAIVLPGLCWKLCNLHNL